MCLKRYVNRSSLPTSCSMELSLKIENFCNIIKYLHNRPIHYRTVIHISQYYIFRFQKHSKIWIITNFWIVYSYFSRFVCYEQKHMAFLQGWKVPWYQAFFLSKGCFFGKLNIYKREFLKHTDCFCKGKWSLIVIPIATDCLFI